MKNLVIAAATAAVLLSGCGAKAGDTSASSSPSSAEATTTAPAAATSDSEATASENSNVPDPCTFLTEAEVSGLTSQPVTQVDHDDAEPGEAVRFCQWQLEGGQLALTMRTYPKDDFIESSTIDGAVPVDDVGEVAYAFAGHLYALSRSWELDVYYRGAASDDQNIEMAKEVALVVIPKLPT